MDCTSASTIVIPPSVREIAKRDFAPFFAEVSRSDVDTVISEHLNTALALIRAETLLRYTQIQGKKLLEVGSGYGTKLAVWIKLYDVDGYGVEPDLGGFSGSIAGSREIFLANQLDPDRILPAMGESLPFENNSFDIVYSANVLEHTQDPAKVISECLRVLRPGGIFHFEVPNFLSYFEGHYMVFQPPLFFEWMLPFWIKYVCRLKPAYARTLRTYINPVWLRRTLISQSNAYPLTILSMGEELFLERLARPFKFDMDRTKGRLQSLMLTMQKLNFGNWIGRLIVLLRGYYPLFVTVRKEPSDLLTSWQGSADRR